MKEKDKSTGTEKIEHFASARGMNLSISPKQSIELSRYLRYQSVGFSKQFLEDVIQLKKPVPFRRFNRDMGHKAGMSAGRFPRKAAKEFLALLKTVEANAQDKGLDTSDLKIIKILANRASTPVTGGRHRTGTKRTHLEIQVKERGKKDDKKRKKTDEQSTVKEQPKVKDQPVEKESNDASSKIEKKEEKPVAAAKVESKKIESKKGSVSKEKTEKAKGEAKE